jgi:3-hydroxymyristoyl/3-hydroxydecanoyl-(acyl carrier protein) dehydratase
VTVEKTIAIPATHPALPGHFPGNPIVPGVVLLEEIVRAMQEHDVHVTGFSHAKFTALLRPGEDCTIRVTPLDTIRWKFDCIVAGRSIMTGTLTSQGS